MSQAVGKRMGDMWAPIPGTPRPGNTLVDGAFWLVICTEAIEDDRRRITLTRGYRYVHESLVSAEREAARLATKFRHCEFAVVRSEAIVGWRQELGRLTWEECRLPAGTKAES
jgi:hypothetical protein